MCYNGVMLLNRIISPGESSPFIHVNLKLHTEAVKCFVSLLKALFFSTQTISVRSVCTHDVTNERFLN